VERGAEAFLRREENEEDLDFQIFQNVRKNLQKVLILFSKKLSLKWKIYLIWHSIEYNFFYF
jgi:hypothetical protein